MGGVISTMARLLSGDLFKFTEDVIHKEFGAVLVSSTLWEEFSTHHQNVTGSQGRTLLEVKLLFLSTGLGSICR